jgi:hypothetical protein
MDDEAVLLDIFADASFKVFRVSYVFKLFVCSIFWIPFVTSLTVNLNSPLILESPWSIATGVIHPLGRHGSNVTGSGEEVKAKDHKSGS